MLEPKENSPNCASFSASRFVAEKGRLNTSSARELPEVLWMNRSLVLLVPGLEFRESDCSPWTVKSGEE